MPSSSSKKGARHQVGWWGILGFLAAQGQSCNLGETITLGRSSGGTIPAPDDTSGHEGGNDNQGGGAGLGGDSPNEPSLELVARDVSVLAEVSDPEKDDNPTLTADELELCVTSKRSGGQGGTDVWCTKRPSTNVAFGELEPVELINADGFDSSPALSLDGLSLWLGTEKEDSLGGLDIFVSTRTTRTDPWATAQRVTELSSEADDIPRPVAVQGTIMPLGSRRGGEGYQTYLAERASPDAPFAAPQPIAALRQDGVEFVDGFLTEDGLLLLYSRVDAASDDPSDIYYSYRSDRMAEFSEPQRLEGINSDADDRDPWLSLDQERLYFASDRDGDFEIFTARIERR